MTDQDEPRKKRSIAARAVAVVLMASTAFAGMPRPAQAFWGIEDITFDPTNMVENTIAAVESIVTADNGIADHLKTYVLDGLAWAVAKAAIQAMTQSIVTWINNGFQGSPAFVTDLKAHLRGVADERAMNFTRSLLNDSQINSPYLQNVVGTIRTGYLLYTSRESIRQRILYDLDVHARSRENALAFQQGNFSRGGFGSWFASTLQCGNDPYCTEFSVQEELINNIDAATQRELTDISNGRGFLSWRGDCGSSNTETAPADDSEAAAGEEATLSDATTQEDCPTQTPGSIIEHQLGITLDSPLHQLELADSINEIVGALATQLVSQVLGGQGGLRGASSPSSSGRGSVVQQGTGSGADAASSSLSAAFSASIVTEKTRIAGFVQNWQTIRQAAAQASQICNQNAVEGGPYTQAQTVVTSADTAIRHATTALTQLDAFAARAEAARAMSGSAQTAAAQTLSQEYVAFIAANPITAEAISCARAQSQDSAPTTPATMFSAMNAISESACGSSGGAIPTCAY